MIDRETWFVREYDNLGVELRNRISFLHNTISQAVFLWAVFTVAAFVLIILNIREDLFYTYLLFIPLVIDLLAFNYQSNQNSLESIPKYFYECIRPEVEKTCGNGVLGWEKYFAEQKEPFKYESVTKVFPFVFPSIIPFYLLFNDYPLMKYQVTLVIVDIVLLLIMIINFRYKLRRVK